MNHFHYIRPRIAEVVVEGERFQVVSERETVQELIRGGIVAPLI